MPSGQTHDRLTLWFLPVTMGACLWITQNSTHTLIVSGAFLFGGLMLTPDLDVRSRPFKRWGWFRWIWIPYQGSMHHRSPLSHAPVIGTTLRIIYLLLWLAIVSFLGLTLLNELVQVGWRWDDIFALMGRLLHRYRQEWIVLIVGLELGAFSHYLADWLVSTFKRVKKQGWKGWQRSLPRPPTRSHRSPKRRIKRR
jgi:uncharacterized metal-binding protein